MGKVVETLFAGMLLAGGYAAMGTTSTHRGTTLSLALFSCTKN